MQAADESVNLAEEQAAVRIVLRPYASALPLGCFAFGIGNALLAAFVLHWIPASEKDTLAIMLLGFVAPLEFVPCAMAFLSRDTGAATAMGIFASAWTVMGIQLHTSDPASPSRAAALFLILLAICLLILTMVTFSGKPLLGVLLSTAILRSISAAICQLGIHGRMDAVNAILDAMVALLAFYSGLAFLMEDIQQKPNRMTFRRAAAKEAVEGTLQEQVKHISNEAGVRQQL
jgi:succinate-acetate transporter protein